MALKNTGVKFLQLGLIDYQKAWDYQEELFNRTVIRKVANRKQSPESQVPTENFMIFCSHPNVFTLGKSGKEENLLLSDQELEQKKARYYKINRGGDITYHGPGQIVGYPILDLDNFFTDIHKYLRYLEEAVIRTLRDYGLHAGRIDGLTGVWLDAENEMKSRKICAMGVKASRWVTMHGFALNVNVDLNYFGYIVPCGIDNRAVTSLNKELGHNVEIAEVELRLKSHLADLFGFDWV